MKSTSYLLLILLLGTLMYVYVAGRNPRRCRYFRGVCNQTAGHPHVNKTIHRHKYHHSTRRNSTDTSRHHLFDRTEIVNGTRVKTRGPFKRLRKARRKERKNEKKKGSFIPKFHPCQNDSLCNCSSGKSWLFINCYNLTTLQSLVDVVQLVRSQYPNKSVDHLTVQQCTFAEVIPDDFLAGTFIQRLIFDRTLVQGMARHAFRGIGDLFLIIFKGLNITSLPDAFRSSEILRVFRMEVSNITTLDTQMTNFSTLQVVTLNHNNLSRIHPDAFQHLERLKTLDLSHNRLTYLDPGNFRDLQQLNLLKLQGNLFKRLDGVLDPVCKTVEEMFLSNNQFESLEGLFNKAAMLLQLLDVSYNRLTAIRASDLANKVPHLNVLYATDNFIEVLEPNAFQTMFSLEFLDIRRNKLSNISPGTFAGLYRFKRIKLDGNRIVNPGEIFKFTHRLTIVYISQNQISDIATAFKLIPQVEDVMLGKNQITVIANNTFIKSGRLRYLSLIHNLISHLEPDAFKGLSSLIKLDLSHNLLRELGGSLHHLGKVKFLWLTNNSLTNVTEEDFPETLVIQRLSLQDNRLTDVSGAFRNLKMLWDVSLSYNSIRILTEGTFPEQTRLKFLSLQGNPLECDCRMGWLVKMTHHRKLNFDKFTACMSPRRFQLFQPKWISTKKIYDWPYGCPDGCSCFCQPHRMDYVIHVNCTRIGFRQLPLSYPDKTVMLNFSHNALESVPSNLSSLLPSLRDLDLEGNLITSLQGVVFPLTLEKLRLANNSMSSFDAKDAVGNRSLALATMSHNPWKCNCSTSNFRSWLLKNSRVVLDINNTRCSSENRNSLQKQTITSLKETDLCPVQIALYVIVVIAILGVLLSAASLFIGYVRYKMPIKVWLYSRGLSCIKQEDLDEDKEFDAFLSFSNEDHDVAEEIARRLETDHPYYKLCLHYRDFPGGNLIMDNICWAVKSSKKIIVLLSRNFLKGDWTLFEFQAAHHQMLEEKINRIILVLLGDLPPSDEIRPDIQAYLTSTTYLKWEDRYLWEKLLFAMPKVAVGSERNHFGEEDMEHLLLAECL